MLSSSPIPNVAVQWHNHVLRQKYRDPLKLKQALTEMYGEGNYKIKVRTERTLLCNPLVVIPV